MGSTYRLVAAAFGIAFAVPAMAAQEAPQNAAQNAAQNAVVADSVSAPETRLCLENRDIRAKNISAANGYFARTPKGWWRNTGPVCSAYDPNRALLTRSIENRQCRGDIIVVFDPFSRIEFGGCVLGGWERVEAPPKN